VVAKIVAKFWKGGPCTRNSRLDFWGVVRPDLGILFNRCHQHYCGVLSTLCDFTFWISLSLSPKTNL